MNIYNKEFFGLNFVLNLCYSVIINLPTWLRYLNAASKPVRHLNVSDWLSNRGGQVTNKQKTFRPVRTGYNVTVLRHSLARTNTVPEDFLTGRTGESHPSNEGEAGCMHKQVQVGNVEPEPWQHVKTEAINILFMSGTSSATLEAALCNDPAGSNKDPYNFF